MIRTAPHPLLALLIAIFLVGCHKGTRHEQTNRQATEIAEPPTPFDADSAYHNIARQVSFGPRVPGTKGHTACLAWMREILTSYGATLTEQSFETTAHDGLKLPLTNLIASFNPEAPRRMLLMAHWDTRPWADKDDNSANHDRPILGADDAGSGVGVLIEIARLLGGEAPLEELGVDIVLFDGEDYGAYSEEDSWCLGSTYWSKHPHIAGYQAMGGILLDMVGGKDATFYWEAYSKSYASQLLSKVWTQAAQLGYGSYFRQADGGGLTDDHVPVIKNLGIPSIDIITYNPQSAEGFAPYWHTMQDDMSNISVPTLSAVGHTVVALLQELDAPEN